MIGDKMEKIVKFAQVMRGIRQEKIGFLELFYFREQLLVGIMQVFVAAVKTVVVSLQSRVFAMYFKFGQFTQRSSL
jgi:hypothetical protein